MKFATLLLSAVARPSVAAEKTYRIEGDSPITLPTDCTVLFPGSTHG